MKRAIKFLLEHSAGALFLDPGLRKTSITLAAIKVLLKKGIIEKVLIIAPIRVCHSVWPAEIEKWKDFNKLKCCILHGPQKDYLLENSDAEIFLINPEGLQWLLEVVKKKTTTGKTRVSLDLRRFKKLGFDTLVVDELSKFKNPRSIRFKAMKLILKTFQRRWGLTGSPRPNGMIDLFGQCYMLDEGRTLGKYITHYRMEYFEQDYTGFNWTLRDGCEDEIYKRISPLALTMSAEDYIKMPKLIENNIMVTLPPEAQEIYDDLERDLIARIDNKTVTAATAAAASMKCRQVANGGIYFDQDVEALIKLPSNKRKWANLHYVKTEALSELIEELQGSPLLVAYDFKHDLDRIKEIFGKDIPYIGGGVSIKKSKKIEDDWNAGKLPVLFGHPASIGHGLNLQESGFHIAWHSMTWDFELYDQFIRRIRRSGQKSKRVFVHHIIAEGTVDELMYKSIKAKGIGHTSFFKALKDLQNKRK
jgi:SNF2 family DNA or RNA helicase